MCLAVRYSIDQRDRIVRFTDNQAQIPVLLKSGDTRLVTWGRREHEYNCFPMGGWSDIWHVRSGLWDQYQPVPVKIKVKAFMDHYIVGCEQWSDVADGSYIQGLLASNNKGQHLYVVCLHFGSDKNRFEPCPRIIMNENRT